jgi:hypothetical protein
VRLSVNGEAVEDVKKRSALAGDQCLRKHPHT